MNKAPIIVGAGLAGLLAAHAWPRLSVVEQMPQPRAAHRALLRFRGTAVSNLVGVEFRKVQVRKGIFAFGRHWTEPNINLANLYAQKVTGALGGERSIWNLQPVERYVAPDTLYEQLVEAVQHRIYWGKSVDWGEGGRKISTAPLNITLAALEVPHQQTFERAPITVVRMKVPKADVFQTVYFPVAEETPMYRASITGDTLIIEGMTSFAEPVSDWLHKAVDLAQQAFGIPTPEILSVVEQTYGKIAPIGDAERKRLLFKLTHDHDIYSLGRFATWRNVLLDDLVQDIAVVKRLMGADAYDVRHAAS